MMTKLHTHDDAEKTPSFYKPYIGTNKLYVRKIKRIIRVL